MKPCYRVAIRLMILSGIGSLGISFPVNADAPPLPRYTIADLGISMRTSEDGARALNDAGDVAGTMDNPDGSHVAFLYRRGKIIELGTLGGKNSQASGINAKRQIVGTTLRATGGPVPFLWEKGRMRAIAPLTTTFGAASGDITVAGINNQGLAAGCAFWLDGVHRPFLWQNGHAPSLPHGSVGLRFVPRGLSDRGEVVGVTGGWYKIHAMLWDGVTERDLGTLVSRGTSCANAINDRGQIVGRASSQGFYQDHAVLWDQGVLRDLGTAGGSRSEALAINAKGQIVGTAALSYEETEGLSHTQWGGDRAILWQNGQTYNLNDLLPADSGWVLERAVAINDRGQIVAIGYRSHDLGKSRIGGMRSVLLSPVTF
ncbi:MAG TPA: DUF3466 family protein [Chthonomonadaceae bacterium]|nr:DUF3466 family protein [Chthonomonadaceae bacterium]